MKSMPMMSTVPEALGLPTPYCPSGLSRLEEKLTTQRLFYVLFVVIAVGLLAPTSVQGQATGTVTGTVTDAENDAPLPGVNIVVVGLEDQGIGAATDAEGRYTIKDVPAGRQALQARFVGYANETREISLEDGETVEASFALEASKVGLDEVVVTGTAGGAQKRSIGNTVATIDAAETADLALVENASQLINGRTPGATVLSGTGMVGTGPRITIRGRSSLSLRGQPLVYVDGARVDNTVASGPAGSSSFKVFSRLNDFHPQDIKRMEVIKGPAAATLFGTEATKGVIQILTKDGQAGESRTRFTVSQGANWLQRTDPFPTNYWRNPETGDINAVNYLEREKNMGNSPFSMGHSQSYGVSRSGGSESVQYFSSLRYKTSEGIEPTNTVEQLTSRLNVDFQPYENVSVNTNFGYSNFRGQIAGQSTLSTIAGLLWSTPTDGSLNSPRRGFFFAPPEVLHEVRDLEQDVDRFTGSIRTSHQPVDWFEHRLTLGLDVVNEVNTRLIKRMKEDNAQFFGSSLASGVKERNDRNALVTTLDYGGTISVPLFSDLTSNMSGGAQVYRRRTRFADVSGEEFPAPGITAIKGAARTFGSDNTVENVTVGGYLQEQVNWKNRLYLTGAVRVDDNSAFGSEFDLVTYPKASATWVISEEPFWSLLFLNSLRLRAAWGKSGQQPQTFAALRTYQPVTGPGDEPVGTPDAPGNPTLAPEDGEELELGFDAELFEGRASIEFTYFNQDIEDALLRRQTAPSGGFIGDQWVNAGKISNSGFEVLVDGSVLDTRSVDWDLTANVATINNEIEDLGIEGREFLSLNNNGRHAEGYPVSSWFMNHVVSAERNDAGEVVNVMCEAEDGGAPVPCSEDPRVFMGNLQPDVTGSFSTTVTLWDRLRLYGLVDFKLGHQKQNGDRWLRCQVFQVCEINVRPDEFSAAEVASASLTESAFALEDADFARLREVSLDYQLPGSITSPLGLQQANLQVSARNLMTWTGYSGLDPEEDFLTDRDPQINFAQVPHLFQLQTTLNITF